VALGPALPWNPFSEWQPEVMCASQQYFNLAARFLQVTTAAEPATSHLEFHFGIASGLIHKSIY
jgi:hypothetical protein